MAATAPHIRSAISPDRFDGAAVWKTLPPKDQDAIGAAALEVLAARFALDETHPYGPEYPPEHRAAEEAIDAADEALDRAGDGLFFDDAFSDGEERVKLPSVIGMVCLTCGCSDNDPCAEGCAWAGPDLCTACEGEAPASAEAGDAA